MCYINVEQAQQEHMQISNPLVKTPSHFKLKFVLSGSNAVSTLSVSKSLYSISNLPSLNSLTLSRPGGGGAFGAHANFEYS